jgi:uncharacterized membrane protein YphA (DoxX/SURF4 family)
MKARTKRDYSNNWVQTVISILGLIFVVLTSLGVITPEQSAQGLPIATDIVTAVSTVIGGIIFLVGLLFKQNPPA